MPIKPKLKPKEKIITIIPQTHDTYLIQGGSALIVYANRSLNRKKAVSIFIHHQLQFNDRLSIQADPHATEATEEFKKELQRQLKKSNPLHIIIQGDAEPDNAAELALKANEKQQEILHHSHTILKKFSRLPYSLFLNTNKNPTALKATQTIESIQNLEKKLRTLQMVSNLLLLPGIFLFLIALANPFIVPLMPIALTVTLVGALLLGAASTLGKKTGVFKNAEQTRKLSDDFLNSQEANKTIAMTPTPTLGEEISIPIAQPTRKPSTSKKENQETVDHKKPKTPKTRGS